MFQTSLLRVCRRACAAVLVAIAAPQALHAQALPDRQVRLLVPFPPGGGSDAVARTVAEALSPLLRRGVVVEHRSGANGMVGLAEVARGPADGSLLGLCSSGPCAINPSLYPNQPYDLQRDFAPVVLLGSTMSVMTVPPSLPTATVAEFLSLARSREVPMTYASSGAGSTTHLAAEMLRARAGIALTQVPYRGGGTFLADHLAGRVDVLMNVTTAMAPHIRSAALRALAVSGTTRSAELPEVPTFAEAGVPGVVMEPWFAVVAPAGTPAGTVAALNAAFNEALRAPPAAARFAASGIRVEGGPADRLGDLMQEEAVRWGELIRANDIRAE